MPILKAISGHTGAHGIKAYLEKGGRALARDFFNLSWDEREMGGYDGGEKAAVPWDAEMDRTRAEFGHDREWKGKRPRTFDHFVLSPDPQDRIDLAALRELARDWALEQFGDHQIAIIYHDDNEHRIPHAHIVVNCTDLATGYKTHIVRPEDLNRRVQDMARERGLRGLSNEPVPASVQARTRTRGEKKDPGPRSRQDVYLGRKERGIVEAGGYSWVTDIRGRVAVAKTLAHSEREFMDLLGKMEVNVSANSDKARREDWVFSLADQPSRKVSGERLGMSFGKQAILRRFERAGSYHPTPTAESVIRARAERAIELNDLNDLDRLANALGTCSRFGIVSLEDFDARLHSKVAPSPETARELEDAREYMRTNRLLPQRVIRERRERFDDSEAPIDPLSASGRRVRQESAPQHEQQRYQRRER